MKPDFVPFVHFRAFVFRVMVAERHYFASA